MLIQLDFFEDPAISALKTRMTHLEIDNKNYVKEIKNLKKQIKELKERINLIEYGLSNC